MRKNQQKLKNQHAGHWPLIRIKLNTTKCSHIKLASSACKKYEYGHFGSRYIKAWFPPGDTFLEIEINTIATFVTRRQRHFQGDFISPNKFLSPTHSH